MSNTSFIKWFGRDPLLGCLILLYKVDFTHRGCYFWKGRRLEKADLKVTFNIVLAGASLSEFMKPKTLFKSKGTEQQQQSRYTDLYIAFCIHCSICWWHSDVSLRLTCLLNRWIVANKTVWFSWLPVQRGSDVKGMGAGVKVELLWYKIVDTKWT